MYPKKSRSISKQTYLGHRQCPDRSDVDKVVKAGKDLIRKIRSLRRAAWGCRSCEISHDCMFRDNFNAHIDSGIAEITEEWGQGSG